MYTQDVTPSTEAAVQQTPTTTAEATSTQAIHPEAGTSPDAIDSTDTTTVHVETATVAQADQVETVLENQTIIDPERARYFIDKTTALVNNPRFWENPNRATRLDEVLNLPMFDDRSMQQFFISAREELTAKVLKRAVETQTVPVPVAEEDIIALAQAKSEAKRKKDAAKAAKK